MRSSKHHCLASHFLTPATDKDISQLKEWGFNVVRLGVMWPGVEPQKGNYNMTYLQIVQDLVRDLARAGIYTIIGMTFQRLRGSVPKSQCDTFF